MSWNSFSRSADQVNTTSLAVNLRIFGKITAILEPKTSILQSYVQGVLLLLLQGYCQNSNSTSTQPQLKLTELGLTQKWVCTPPTPPKLNFHHKEPQINLLCNLTNNINIKNMNNDKNNINADKKIKNNNKNNHKTKQPQNNEVVTSS